MTVSVDIVYIVQHNPDCKAVAVKEIQLRAVDTRISTRLLVETFLRCHHLLLQELTVGKSV